MQKSAIFAEKKLMMKPSADDCLNVCNVEVSYPVSGGGGRVYAVRGVSFNLARGETLGLVGESGCGKSSLSKALVGLAPLSTGFARNGDLKLEPGAAVSFLKKWRKRIQMVFQDPYSSLNPRMRIGAMLDEVLQVHTGLDPKGRASRIGGLLEQVGLPPSASERFAHQFSGGQRQRLGIARALCVGAPYLILDEPVSALDVSVQAQVINLLRDLQRKENLGYLFVSHDLAVVEYLSDRIAVMYLGRIVEYGLSRDVSGKPCHPYTRSLLDAFPTPEQGLSKDYRPLQGEPPSPLAPPPGCPFEPRCPRATALCREQNPELLEREDGHFCACFNPLTQP